MERTIRNDAFFEKISNGGRLHDLRYDVVPIRETHAETFEETIRERFTKSAPAYPDRC